MAKQITERSTWRAHAKPIIQRVLAESRDLPEKEIKAALREAYPFGQRAMHPYRIWCDEIRRQRGLKKKRVASEPMSLEQLSIF